MKLSNQKSSSTLVEKYGKVIHRRKAILAKARSGRKFNEAQPLPETKTEQRLRLKHSDDQQRIKNAKIEMKESIKQGKQFTIDEYFHKLP